MEHSLNCNLELCLSPPSPSSATLGTSTSQCPDKPIAHLEFPVADLTELQVRAIIVRATRKMDEKRSTCRIRAETNSSPIKQLAIMNNGGSPSMKRSLQRFLQKRKHRIQTISPYTH